MYARVKVNSYRYLLLLLGIVGGMLLTSCGNDGWSSASDVLPSAQPSDNVQLVEHSVSVSLNDAATRVGYQSVADGLQLSWEANETLGVYIRKADNSISYAGTVTSSGTAGERGERHDGAGARCIESARG